MGKRLQVRLSPAVLEALPAIWWYTAGRFSVEQADRYVDWLRSQLESLPDRMAEARKDPELPEAYLWLLKRRPGWRHHGFLAVAYIEQEALVVVELRHTARPRQID